MSRYKPYPEYKDSGMEWLPKLPVHWKTLRLGAIFQERGERGGEKSELLAVSQQYGVLPQAYLMEITERRLSASSSDDWSNYRRVCKGDIVYNKMRLWQGAIGLSEHDGIVSPAYVVLNPLTEVSGQFYEYLFKTSLFVTEAGRYSQGLCDDMNSCRYEDFKSARIILPTLNEQHMIVTYLERETAPIDALVNAKTRFIELLREKRQALITHAVTKGLDHNAKMKDSGVEWLGQVPKHWDIKRLKYSMQLLSEKTAQKGRPVALENIEGWTGRLIEAETEFESDGVCFQTADILFGKLRPYLAKVYLAESPGEAVGDFFVLRPKSHIYPPFAQYHLLNSEFIKIVDSSTFGAKMPRVSWDFFSNMLITLPPKNEQQDIVIYLDRQKEIIDLLITKTERSIELLKERRSALITAAVTGQIDLREVE